MRLLFYFLFCVCFNFACTTQNTLYIGVGSNISKSAEMQQTAEELAAYLSQKLDVPVKINSLKPGKTLEQIQEKKLDIALMNTFGYVLASSESSMEGLVVVANDKKEAISYKSCILAHPSTEITDLDKLKQEANKHTFGFVTSSSTSGHLVPRLYLNRSGLQPEISFKEIVFAGSHKELIKRISINDIKVGAVSYTDLEQLIAEGKYKKEQFNVIWISEPIVNGPVSIKKDLSENTKKKLQEILLALPTENPSLNKKIVKFWHNTDEKSTFIPAQNAFYDNIKKMAESMGEISLLVGLYSD